MLNFIIVEQSQYQRMPWKNGLGETLEIQRHEDKDGLRFRISQASVVESGVFSDFSGLHRTLVLLSGEGITLSHKSVQDDLTLHKLNAPLDMARFAGGDETNAILSHGSIEDLNIMVRESDTKSDVNAYFAPRKFEVKKQDTRLFTAFYANQPCQIAIGESETLALETNHCLIVKQSGVLCLTKGSGVFINITDKSTTVT
jgi:environmental stress-induced protein Ves